jgi:hypothetical protein
MGKARAWWNRPKGMPTNVFKCWNAMGRAVNVEPIACLNVNHIGHGVVSSGILSR